MLSMRECSPPSILPSGLLPSWYSHLLFRILVRSEFDPEHLCLDETGTSSCFPEVIDIFGEYSTLLLQTHEYVVNYLESSPPLPIDASYANLVQPSNCLPDFLL